MSKHALTMRGVRSKRYWFALLALASAGLVVANRATTQDQVCGGVRISGPDLQKLMPGKTMSIVAADGSQTFSQTFFRNGKLKSERSPFGLGNYKVVGDKLCTATDGKSWYCTPIFKAKNYYFAYGQSAQKNYCLKISIK